MALPQRNGKNTMDISDHIVRSIEEFIADSPDNNLQNEAREKAFDRVFVGFAAGDDPLFEDYKAHHIGAFHWTPAEVFNATCPETPAESRDLTVVSWVLGQTRATRADNRKQSRFPAERWARARVFGEETNVALRHSVVAGLKDAGIDSVAPMLTQGWQRVESNRFGFASTWSERHAAYAAGLGTFGLCDGLITPLGKAMRTGSVVARVRIDPTPREYTDHHAYCLFYSQGKCGKCIKRCPAGAISKSGHDKIACKTYMRSIVKPYIEEKWGFYGRGCGLCQTKIPCEFKIPDPKLRANHTSAATDTS